MLRSTDRVRVRLMTSANVAALPTTTTLDDQAMCTSRLSATLELRHLRAFLAVAHTRHFGHAAARLNTSKPALSQQIAQLERLIGGRLFVRTSRRVDLTALGEVVLAEAAPIDDHLHRLALRATRARNGTAGSVRLGTPANLPPGLLRGMLELLALHAPEVEVDMHRMSTSEQLVALRRGTVDVAIVRERTAEKELRYERLLAEPLGVAVARDALLARCDAVPLSRLAGQTLYWFAPATLPALHAQFRAAVARDDVVPLTVREGPDLASVLEFVAAGYGISLVFEREVAAFSRSAESAGDIVWRPLLGATLDVTLWLAWPADAVDDCVAGVAAALRRSAVAGPC